MDAVIGYVTPVQDWLEKFRQTHIQDATYFNKHLCIDTPAGIAQYDDSILLFHGYLLHADALPNHTEDLPYTKNALARLLLALYLKEGIDFLKKLDGGFQIIIWDAAQEKLLLSRDRYGIYPLFYHAEFRERGRFTQFFFSDRIQELWDLGIEKQIDGSMLLNFMLYGQTAHPQKQMATLYSNILSLPPGHYLQIYPKQGRVQMRNWWRWSSSDNSAEGKDLSVFHSEALLSNGQVLPYDHDICDQYLRSHGENRHLPQYDHPQSLITFAEQSEVLDEPVSNNKIWESLHTISGAKSENLLSAAGCELIGGGYFAVDAFLREVLFTRAAQFKKERNSWLNALEGTQWNKKMLFLYKFFPKISMQKTARQFLQNHLNLLHEEFMEKYYHADTVALPTAKNFKEAQYDFLSQGALESILRQLYLGAAHAGKHISYPFLSNQVVRYALHTSIDNIYQNGENAFCIRALTKDPVNPKSGRPLFIPGYTQEELHTALQLLQKEKILAPHISLTDIAKHTDLSLRILQTAFFVRKVKS